MDKYEQQETGNPKPSGNISYYKSLKEICLDFFPDDSEIF